MKNVQLILGAALLTAGLACTTAAAKEAGNSKAIAAAVADSSRPAADTGRDANRKPADTLAFSGVKPGICSRPA